MNAVDTNVLARWILCDDEAQYERALRILSQPCQVSWTVLLELAWLLKSHAGLDRPKIAAILTALLDTPTLHFPRPDALIWAVERFARGADIADVIHIASASEASAFVTFDKRLVAKAGPDSPIPVVSL